MKPSSIEALDQHISTSRLSVSCVTYSSSLEVLTETIASLAKSCAVARENGLVNEVQLYLIDNGPNADNLKVLREIETKYQSYFEQVKIETGHGNVGYGRGHNLAIKSTQCDYHLVLNPDVTLAADNISIAVDYMNKNLDVGLLAPDAFEPSGVRQYIAKREPRITLLAARATGFLWLKSHFATELAQYEYRDLIPSLQPLEIELASGCYMFFRTRDVKKTGGFDSRYFMYFEDFDLSKRIRAIAKVVHHPRVTIVHAGGSAFSKGLKHIIFFISSYLKFSKR